MTESEHTPGPGDSWQESIERMNEQFVDALERNVQAQSTFTDAWLDALDRTLSEERIEEGTEGYARAYEAWMSAARDSVEAMADALEGEEVPVETFRDTWLNAANQAFKEIMGTAAFAAATGEAVEQSLDLRTQATEAAESALHNAGMATTGDVREVGERLVELERRQHAVERKLDRVIEGLED